MSRKYKAAMDKITASDELKAKIIAASDKVRVKEKQKFARTAVFRMRYAAGIAACAAALCISFSINKIGYEKPPIRETVVKNDKNTENNVEPPQNDNTFTPPVSEEQPPAKGNLQEEKSKPQESTDGKKQPLPPSDEAINPPQEELPKKEGGQESKPPVMGAKPFEEIQDIEALRAQAGYNFRIPKYIPEGYELKNMGILFGELIQLRYENAEDEIIYRTQKSAEDISGDYNTYETVETENVSGTEVTVRRNGDIVGSAIWYDEDAYSITSEKGISKDDVLKMVTSVAE